MADVKYKVDAGFFDAIDEDRTYSAEDMNRPYRKIISNGVFATPAGTPSDFLQVFAAGNEMNVIVSAGYALIGDKWFENPSDLMITISQNSEVLTRIDSIVAQVDKTQEGREGSIVYRQGQASSNPVHPNINTKEDIAEFRLADIIISPSCVEITQNLITDCRGSSECPWVTSLIYQVDTSTLYVQWQEAYKQYYKDQEAEHDAYFEEFKNIMSNFFKEEEKTFDVWFERIKGQLSEEAAGKLQLEIDNLKNKIEEVEIADKEISISPIEPTQNEILWVKRGKNRLDLSRITTGTVNGVTVTKSDDGSITLNGTATSGFSIKTNINLTLSNGTYTHSVQNTKSNIFFSLDNINETMLNNISEKTFNLTEKTTYSQYIIWIENGTSFSNNTFYPMICEGTEGLEYEPYEDTTINIKENGVFNEIFNVDEIDELETKDVPYTMNDANNIVYYNFYATNNEVQINADVRYSFTSGNAIKVFTIDNKYLPIINNSQNALRYPVTTDKAGVIGYATISAAGEVTINILGTATAAIINMRYRYK